MNQTLRAALFFLPEQEIQNLEPFGGGNINETYLITRQQGTQLVLQRINPRVFPEPVMVQRNMRLVTAHLSREINNSPELTKRFFSPVLFLGKRGDSYQAEDGAIWRLVHRISGTTCERVSSPSQAEELGRCLGTFHRLLSTLDPAELVDTIPGFHQTRSYLDNYDRAWKEHDQGHNPELQFSRQFITSRRTLSTLLEALPQPGRGIIHGDPKVANFVFDAEQKKVISLIDLDTVRPGLLLHDIGDALRSCCNSAGESAATPEQVRCDPDLFAAWFKGYFAEAGLLLTNGDKAHIVQAVRVIAFELGLRFVTDHLEGDPYFFTTYQGQNLERALVQFQLVQSVEDQMQSLEEIVSTLMNEQ